MSVTAGVIALNVNAGIAILPTTMPLVGENVRGLRLQRGLKQGKLAERAGVTQQWLSDLENGRYVMPDTENLIKLAVALAVSVDDLLLGTIYLTPLSKIGHNHSHGG